MKFPLLEIETTKKVTHVSIKNSSSCFCSNPRVLQSELLHLIEGGVSCFTEVFTSPQA